MKKEVLSEASTADRLVKLDVTDKSIHVSYKKIDIGFLTEKALKDSVGASEKQVLEFRLQCKTILIELLQKLLTKCPASYSLVRNLSAFNPREMGADVDHCISRFIRFARTQTSAISEHANNTGHLLLWNEVKFIDRDPHCYTRRVKEAIHIRLHPKQHQQG